MRTLIFTCLAVITMSDVVLAEEWLGVWLEKNEPRVISYLRTLGPTQIGERTAGVTLSDNKKELENFKYFEKYKIPRKAQTFIYFEILIMWLLTFGLKRTASLSRYHHVMKKTQEVNGPDGMVRSFLATFTHIQMFIRTKAS